MLIEFGDSKLKLLEVNSRNIRTRCEICSKLTIKAPEGRHCSSASNVNFEHVIAD